MVVVSSICLAWSTRRSVVSLRSPLESIIQDSVTFTNHTKRKTVTAMDVFYVQKVFLVSCHLSSKGGKGLGKGGGKRHRNVLHDNIQGFTKPDNRCLMRCGGVRCISTLVVSSRSPFRTFPWCRHFHPPCQEEDWEQKVYQEKKPASILCLVNWFAMKVMKLLQRPFKLYHFFFLRFSPLLTVFSWWNTVFS